MSNDTKLLAAQAANKRLREALGHITNHNRAYTKTQVEIAYEALTTPGDTAELDALVKQRDELLAAIPPLLYEAYNYGQFADDFNQPLAKPIRKAIRDILDAMKEAKK